MKVLNKYLPLDKVMRYVTETKDSYQYQWFSGKKLESGMFPHSSLIIVDDKESTNE